MNLKQWVVVCVLSFLQSACGARAPVEVTTDAQAVAVGNNEFAIDMYTRLQSDNPANFCFSPYSIATALAMTSAGAIEQTKEEMVKTLHFPLPDEKLHPAFDNLRNVITFNNGTPGFRIRVANRLWGQEGYPILPAFQQVARDNYGADLGFVDFQQVESARTAINSWIARETEDMIPVLFEPRTLNGDTRLVLANAIYFRAKWTHEFFPRATSPAPFHVTSKTEVVVPMMHQRAELRYAVTDDVQVAELPYGKDESLSLLILLPNEIDGLKDLEERLTSENLRIWTSSMRSQSVEVYLPKFKMTSEFSMKEVLESMGMSRSFSIDADFTGLSSHRPLFLSNILHKVFLDVNEEGTEAVAVTSAKTTTAAAPLDTIEFRADHPFLFLIRDNRTDSILFLGRLMNPVL